MKNEESPESLLSALFFVLVFVVVGQNDWLSYEESPESLVRSETIHRTDLKMTRSWAYNCDNNTNGSFYAQCRVCIKQNMKTCCTEYVHP